MKQFTKKYQLWTAADGAFTFQEFDTLAECVSAPKYSEWYITKGVTITVTEAGELPSIPVFPPSLTQVTTGQDLLGLEKVDEIITDEDRAYAQKMAGGRVGNIG